jgi:hypothetical protein
VLVGINDDVLRDLGSVGQKGLSDCQSRAP